MKTIIKLLPFIFLFIILVQSCWLCYLYINPKVETIIQTEIKEVEVEKIVEKIVEVEVEKEVIVEVEKEPTYVYNITSTEREMLARLVYLEANIDSLDCQKAVISSVINRWQDGKWGDTLSDVVYAKGQYTPAFLISKTTPTERNYEAVDYVLKNGCTIPKYVMYFRMDYGFSQTYEGYEEYIEIDNTFFGYLIKDKNK